MFGPADIQETEETAYTEGFDAQRQGFSRSDCPYPKRSKAAAWWLAGFSESDRRDYLYGGNATPKGWDRV